MKMETETDVKRSAVVGIPTYDGRALIQTVLSASGAHREGTRVSFGFAGSSLLARNFNELWCQAVNNHREKGWQYFAMLHSDIVPAYEWLDEMIDVMDEYNLDVVSAVVPIGHGEPDTSTAWGDFRKRHFTRINCEMLGDLPDVITGEHAPDGCILCVNTGCWVARLDRDWNTQICFQIRNFAGVHEDGLMRHGVISEDWDWSRQLHDLGVPYAATTRVRVAHETAALQRINHEGKLVGCK